MTSFVRLSGLKTITVCAALSMTAGLALAGQNVVPADQIVHALQPKPLTRGLSFGAPQPTPAMKMQQMGFIRSIRNRKTRSLSLGERDHIAEISSTKPNIDLNIQFDFNSAAISKASLPAALELGKALSDPRLKGSTFVVAGNTDAVGSEPYNQALSDRRADTIKHFLVDNYGIKASDLITVGYGKTRLRDPEHPTAAINRRVEVVNMKSQTALK